MRVELTEEQAQTIRSVLSRWWLRMPMSRDEQDKVQSAMLAIHDAISTEIQSAATEEG